VSSEDEEERYDNEEVHSEELAAWELEIQDSSLG